MGRASIIDFAKDQFFPYPDSSIQEVIDQATVENASALQKKIRPTPNCSNALSLDVAELDSLLQDTIELQSYPEAKMVRLNVISDEIK